MNARTTGRVLDGNQRAPTVSILHARDWKDRRLRQFDSVMNIAVEDPTVTRTHCLEDLPLKAASIALDRRLRRLCPCGR